MAKEQEANKNEPASANADQKAAKQERQQESEKKRNVLLEYDGKNFQVKNEGDDKPLYESENREASFEFAHKIADEHNVEVVVSDRAKESEKKEKEEAAHDHEGEKREEKSEGRRYEERETQGPQNVLVEDDGKYYIVRNEGDRAKLYESENKDATLDFARKMAQEHEVDLIVLDRDKRVQMEEKYTTKEKASAGSSQGDKGNDKDSPAKPREEGDRGEAKEEKK